MTLVYDEIIPGKGYNQYLLNGVPTGDPSVSNLTSRRSRLDKLGVKRKKPQPYMSPTSLTVSSFFYENVHGERLEKGSSPSESYYVYGVLGPSPSVSVPSRSVSRKQRAETQALLRLKDQKVNLGIAFATADQTADLLGTAGRTIAEKFAKSGDPTMRIPRMLSNGVRGLPKALLENQYGWKPLLSDVKGSLDKMKSDATNAGFMVTVRGSDTEKWRLNEVEYQGSVLQRRVTGYEEAGCKVRLDYMPENPLLIQLSSLGVTNPLLVAWDKVPYSFIVDWCLPIGDWLSTLDAALGYQFLGGTYTYRERAERRYLHYADGVPELVWARGSGYSRAKEISRGTYSSSPLPRPPSPRNPLKSLTHMWEGLALLQKAFR